MKTSQKMNKWHILLVVLVSLGSGVAYKLMGEPEAQHTNGGARSSQFGSVQKGDLLQRVTIAGILVPQRRTVIMAPFNGYVKKIFVRVGDIVKAGDPLVSVVQSLNSGEDTYPMRAPFPGRVVGIQKTEGENVKQNDEKEFILKIDDMSQVFIEADIPEMDRVKIVKGQEAIVKVTAILDRSYKGIVRDMDLSARETERWSRASQVEFPMRVEITDSDTKLYSGMTAIIDIITAKRENVFMLRHEYLRKKGEEYFVTLKSGERRNVKVGIQNEEVFEIVSGLTEKDKVRLVDFLSLVSE